MSNGSINRNSVVLLRNPNRENASSVGVELKTNNEKHITAESADISSPIDDTFVSMSLGESSGHIMAGSYGAEGGSDALAIGALLGVSYERTKNDTDVDLNAAFVMGGFEEGGISGLMGLELMAGSMSGLGVEIMMNARKDLSDRVSATGVLTLGATTHDGMIGSFQAGVETLVGKNLSLGASARIDQDNASGGLNIRLRF